MSTPYAASPSAPTTSSRASRRTSGSPCGPRTPSSRTRSARRSSTPRARATTVSTAISAFWDLAIAPVKEFRFTIRDSFANGNACANIGTFSTELEDGSLADTDLIAVYRVNDEGLFVSMAAHWEMERTLATVRKPE